MSPTAVLVGNVLRERALEVVDGGEGVLFETPRGHRVLDPAGNAILVVLEPDQNPKEVAETILWALR